jgi:glycosyltransferase involved in cell wall biosynthesis
MDHSQGKHVMSVRRIALIGTHPPRQCGIAVFMDDLAHALVQVSRDIEVLVVGMNDGQSYPYPVRVRVTIDQDTIAAYKAAADALNELDIDVLCVQHEFGIFGGPAGSYLLTLLRHVRAPVVTTLHTVLEKFTTEQCAVIEELIFLSEKVVVMSDRAVTFLVAQGVPRRKIDLIHHGIPNLGSDRETEKARMGLSERSLILTFGLLSPNKGIETALQALPAVIRDVPQVTYLVLGATHPHIRAQHGEAYRERLTQLATELGVAAHVRFDDRFAESEVITRAIAAADICLFPYQNREQITSGTLARAFGNGKAVISTPFWHAQDLLAEGRGVLVPFRDSGALGAALRDLLRDPDRLAEMEVRALTYGERMRWPDVGRSYLEVFEAVQCTNPVASHPFHLPTLTLDHVAALTDGTGILQHALVAVANPFAGYTTDDNARALELAVLAGDAPHATAIARRTLSFLHYAFNPSTRRFRNFMTYDRHWLDDDGGENTQARAVRALVTAAYGLKGALASTAQEILSRSWTALDHLTWPRAQAIALVALSKRAEHVTPEPPWVSLGEHYAGNLLRLHDDEVTTSWPWFEPYLSYSNAKLPHGLITYGRVFQHQGALATGLDALRWLEDQQSAPDGSFLPVGSERVYRAGEARPLWDGQPIEVYATVAAALEAHRATGDAAWIANARRALEWLLGRNALRTPLHDDETGGCRDGLHRDRANANQGAESTLALWLSVAEYNLTARLAVTRRARGM